MDVLVRQTKQDGTLAFDVTVRERPGDETHHAVTLDAGLAERLTRPSGASAADLVRAVFDFLLERESKESILGRFDVTVVSRYFPEFEDEIGSYVVVSKR